MGLFNKVYPQLTAGPSLTCAELDGDKHGLYRVSLMLWFDAPSGGNILMRPNGATTNLSNDHSINQGTPSQLTTWRIGAYGSTAASVFNFGSGFVYAAREINGVSVLRTMIMDVGNGQSAAGNNGCRESNGVWIDTGENLESLVFFSDNDNIAVGSYVHIEQLLPDYALA